MNSTFETFRLTMTDKLNRLLVLTLLLCLSFFNGPIQAQSWTVQPSGTTQNLWGIWGADASNIWAVGNAGTILKWNGSTWTPQTSGTSQPLFAVWGTDVNNVWVIGNAGTILKWDGSTWSPQTSGTTKYMDGLWGTDVNNVWTVGETGTILKWDGSTWSPQSSGTSDFLYRAGGVDASNIWAVGAFGVIRKWNGTSWIGQTQPLGAGVALFDVWANASNSAWTVGGNGNILRWNGSTWTVQASGTTQLLRGLWGIDVNNVWTMGNAGTIIKRSGSTWTPQTSGTTQNLSAMWSGGIGNVWIVGANGTILYSNDQSLCNPHTITAPTVTQPTCANPTGTIVVNATGSGAREYSVDNGVNWSANATFSGLAPGSYNIKVRLVDSPVCETVYGSNPVVLTSPFITTSIDTWTGCVSTDWSNPANWRDGTVPTSTEQVTIPNMVNDPVISTTVIVKSVQVQSGALLNITPTGNLTTTGI